MGNMLTLLGKYDRTLENYGNYVDAIGDIGKNMGELWEPCGQY